MSAKEFCVISWLPVKLINILGFQLTSIHFQPLHDALSIKHLDHPFMSMFSSYAVELTTTVYFYFLQRFDFDQRRNQITFEAISTLKRDSSSTSVNGLLRLLKICGFFREICNFFKFIEYLFASLMKSAEYLFASFLSDIGMVSSGISQNTTGMLALLVD